METMPMPLDALGAAPGGLDEFRITAPREIAAMLKQLCDGNVQLNLNSADGHVITGTVWTIDPVRGTMGFDVDAKDPVLGSLLESSEVIAVGYLDSVKLQFDVTDLVQRVWNRAS